VIAKWITKLATDQTIDSPYLTLTELESKGKTKIFEVENTKHGYKLGQIKWYPQWRQYTFVPNSDTIFSSDCLNAICNVLNKLKEERRNKNNGGTDNG
jgi:hypothetical protein